MAVALCRSKRLEILSKRRQDLALNQTQREQEQYSGLAFSHLLEQEPVIFEDGYENYPHEPPYSVGYYMNNAY